MQQRARTRSRKRAGFGEAALGLVATAALTLLPGVVPVVAAPLELGSGPATGGTEVTVRLPRDGTALAQVAVGRTHSLGVGRDGALWA